MNVRHRKHRHDDRAVRLQFQEPFRDQALQRFTDRRGRDAVGFRDRADDKRLPGAESAGNQAFLDRS